MLDCGGITNPDASEFLAGVAAELGVSDAETKAAWSPAWAASRATPQTLESYWRMVFKAVGVEYKYETAHACDEIICAGLRQSYPETLELAERLKQKGVCVGMISNHLVNPNWFEHCAEGARLRSLVSDPSLLIVSQAVGVGKPDPRIYDLFFSALRCLHGEANPSQLVFVDDKQKNVDAAMALGWRGLCYDARRAAPGDLARELAALGLPGSADE